MLMRDSVNASLIPLDTPVVAGYGDGLYMWSSADWARFTNNIALSIVVFAGDSGDILDVENGDASPSDVPGWIDRFNRANRRRATIYCNRSTIDAVRAAAGNRAFDWWAATLDGTQSVPGAVAVQYTDTGAYDESVILDPRWVGANMNVTDRVVPATPVPARIWRDARWYNWTDLAPLQTTGETGSINAGCVWTEAILVDGTWYDRVNGGDWCLQDADLDDGGHAPPDFRPPPPAPTPPPPPPPPPPDPLAPVLARLDALEQWRARLKNDS